MGERLRGMTPVKIGFVLLSNSANPVPSTRIAALNMFPFLRLANFDPHIIFEPSTGTEVPDLQLNATKMALAGFRIVFFQKVHGPHVEAFAKELSAVGIRTVYSVCDLVCSQMAEATDSTVVVTDYLRSLYPPALQHKIYTVHDGIENPNFFKTEHGSRTGTIARPLRAVLVTSAGLDHVPLLRSLPSWLEVTVVGRYPPAGQFLDRFREVRWKIGHQKNWQIRLGYIRFLASRRIKCRAWDPVGVYASLLQSDIAIIPIGREGDQPLEQVLPGWKVKSENRLTMKMCAGLPVISTPIPSYLPVINHGINGFLANSASDWQEYLTVLRDPDTRRRIGERARASVIERYSMHEQARLLIDVLHRLMNDPRPTDSLEGA